MFEGVYNKIGALLKVYAVLRFLYNENHAIVAWLKRGLPMSLEKKTPIV